MRVGKTTRPVMRVLDVLGRRWSLRILWELRGPSRTFRALREACDDVSPSSLNQRIRDLRELGVVESKADGYALTSSGRRLGAVLLTLCEWADDEARFPRR